MTKVPGRRPSKRTRAKGRPWSPQGHGLTTHQLRELMRRCPQCGEETPFWLRDRRHVTWVVVGYQEGYGELFEMRFVCEKPTAAEA